jgi:hypothetical protein
VTVEILVGQDGDLLAVITDKSANLLVWDANNSKSQWLDTGQRLSHISRHLFMLWRIFTESFYPGALFWKLEIDAYCIFSRVLLRVGLKDINTTRSKQIL